MRKNKKPNEIKPGKPAEVIDQESQVEKVQELTTEQMDNTPIEPNTIIVDPSVETDPVEKGPVLDEPLTEKEQKKQEDEYVDPADTLNPSEEDEFDVKAEAKLAGKEDAKEPTRYGAGKEVIADKIEEGGDSRHYPPSLHGDPTGTKNEYPR